MKHYKTLILLLFMASLPIALVSHNKHNIQSLVTPRDSPKVLVNAFNYNDTYINKQWGLFTVGANLAHQIGINGTNRSSPANPIIVAILDTGVDYNHPDLKDNYLTGAGYDYIDNDNDPMDENGHGTHCAGIIAAGMNDIGICGIAPFAKIIAFRVLDANGEGPTANLVAAINDILLYYNPQNNITHGVDIISMSLGASDISEPTKSNLQTAINNAVASRIIVLAASGNEDTTPILYPARFQNSIAIGAVSIFQERASYSNYGPMLNFTAPGGDWYLGIVKVGILSTIPNNGYAYYCGTSMATPMAAGVVALLLSNYTKPNEVIGNLTERAKDLGSENWDQYYGNGLVRIIPNDWDYNTWFHTNYDMEILLTLLIMFSDIFLPTPQLDMTTLLIIGSITIFFVVIAIYSMKDRS
jgi:subtilisin family serine protease